MSLRWRVALGLALVAALVGAFAAVGSYVTTARQLRSGVDETLLARARTLDPLGRRLGTDRVPPPERRRRCPSPAALQATAAAQLVSADGQAFACVQGGVTLPVDERDVAVARDPRGGPLLRTVSEGGVSYRQLTFGWARDIALQIGRDLSEQQATLERLRLRLALLTLAGVAGAAALGWFLAGRIVQPVDRLRAAAEDIAATDDLTTPLPTDGPGEVGSLARSLHTMMGALATSREQQQRLVMDASHELRTPLTTLRTNVELLQRAPDLPEAQRAEILRDLDLESRELTDLVEELVELSTDRGSADEAPEPLDLADVAQAAIERAQRRTARAITLVRSDDQPVMGRPRMLERAVSNLVDNAVKYGGSDDIEVMVEGTSVEVRDHGLGIAASDQPLVFDRFYRATTARTEPGSGLGLAIVRQIVDRHGGEVWARNLTGVDGATSGAAVGFRLPPAPPA